MVNVMQESEDPSNPKSYVDLIKDALAFETYLKLNIGLTPRELEATQKSAAEFPAHVTEALARIERRLLREKSRDTETEMIWHKMVFGAESFATMFSVKTVRMVAALRNKDPKEIDDSILDLAGYAVLCMAWLSEAKQQICCKD